VKNDEVHVLARRVNTDIDTDIINTAASARFVRNVWQKGFPALVTSHRIETTYVCW